MTDVTDELTDYQILKTMFDKADIVYYIDHTAAGHKEINGTVITVTAKDGEQNLGYPYFFAAFIFDKDGNLKSVGAWE